MDAASLDPASASLFRDGLQAQQQQNFAEAAKAYTALLETSPDFLPARFNLGLVLDAEGKSQQALDEFDEVRGEAPTFPGVQLFTGIENFRLGKMDAAASTLHLAAEQSPKDPRCWFWLAKTEFAAQHESEGKAALDEALQVSPDDPSSLYLLSQYEIAGQDLTSSESILTGLVARYPEVPEFHQSLGSVFYLEAQLDKAEAEYRKQLDIDPKSAQALSMLGVILLDRGAAQQAIPYLQQGLAVNARIPFLQRKLGQALIAVGEPQDAIAHLREAVELDPQESTAHFLLWKVYSAQHRNQEAAVELDAFRKLQKKQQAGPGVAGKLPPVGGAQR
jgi:superkiller protein 3